MERQLRRSHDGVSEGRGTLRMLLHNRVVLECAGKTSSLCGSPANGELDLEIEKE